MPTLPVNQLGRRLGRRPSHIADVAAALAQGDADRVPYLTAGLRCREYRLGSASGAALLQCGEPGMLALLRAAAHGRRRERLAAVECLGKCRDPRALGPLIDALEHDKMDRMVTRTVRIGGALALMMLVMIVVFVVSMATSLGDGWPLFGGGGNSGGADNSRWKGVFDPDIELRLAAARALGTLGDIRALRPLTRLAHHREPEVRQAARDAALSLVEAACNLPPEQVLTAVPHLVPELARMLSEADSRLARQILALLARVGDVRALPAVERIGKDLSRPDLASQAQEVCDTLRQRAENEESRTTLLRVAATSAVDGGAALLRPVLPTPAPNRQEELLRALTASTESGSGTERRQET